MSEIKNSFPETESKNNDLYTKIKEIISNFEKGYNTYCAFY